MVNKPRVVGDCFSGNAIVGVADEQLLDKVGGLLGHVARYGVVGTVKDLGQHMLVAGVVERVTPDQPARRESLCSSI